MGPRGIRDSIIMFIYGSGKGSRTAPRRRRFEESIMAARTGVKIMLSGVHLCCGGCTDAADNALRSVEGVDSDCDMDRGTVSITAGDATKARQALDSLARAGLYGVSDNPSLAMRPVGEIPVGKVNRLRVSGIHNCCDLCCDAIQRAVATVDGVTGDTARPGGTSFEVVGDFRPASLVKVLNDAGFSAHVES
jgi:copper chaperone CopZ